MRRRAARWSALLSSPNSCPLISSGVRLYLVERREGKNNHGRVEKRVAGQCFILDDDDDDAFMQNNFLFLCVYSQ